MKISRFGHRKPKDGVITVATEVIGNKLFIGTSFCSPTEPMYDKAKGRELAVHRLAQIKKTNDYVDFEQELTHENVIKATLSSIIDDNLFPRWAEDLLYRSYQQPHGLKRIISGDILNKPIDILQIVVNSEYAKEQLLKALRYIQSLEELDTGFHAVNILAHAYLNPEQIVVASEDQKSIGFTEDELQELKNITRGC